MSRKGSQWKQEFGSSLQVSSLVYWTLHTPSEARLLDAICVWAQVCITTDSVSPLGPFPLLEKNAKISRSWQLFWCKSKGRDEKFRNNHKFMSVQFSRSVVSDSLRPHESQHTRPPCPSPTPRVYSNSCPSCRWCHPAISSSVVPFSSCPQSLPASGSFPMSQLFTSGGQSIVVSASASVLPGDTQDWSPLGWTGWISLQSKGLSRVFSNTTVQKHQFFATQLSLQSNSHIHTWPLEKP